jgi:hypothetical protein
MIASALVFSAAVYLSLLVGEQFTEVTLYRRQLTERFRHQALLCACLWGLFFYLYHG